ncbi:MAG: amino acid permease, partial [Candidatus Eremiobacteraeota bacterium]|nr:amino acid permease [Candidatus Eremiobacteraeota bacterium]
MNSTLFRRKDVGRILSEANAPGPKLKRALGALDLISLGIGAIIGAGIFVVVGAAAAGDPSHPGAGPGLVISMLIVAI